jgi:hypothetical protein
MASYGMVKCASCGDNSHDAQVALHHLVPSPLGGASVPLCARCRAPAETYRGTIEEARKLISFGITHSLNQQKNADQIISEVGPVAGNMPFASSHEIARSLNARSYNLGPGHKWDANSAAQLVLAYRARVAGAGGKTYDHQGCGCESCLEKSRN